MELEGKLFKNVLSRIEQLQVKENQHVVQESHLKVQLCDVQRRLDEVAEERMRIEECLTNIEEMTIGACG